MEKSIEIQPKRRDINEILSWIKEEKETDKFGYGFYNNKSVIIDSFELGKAIVLKCNNKNIGLITWCDNDILIKIDIFVIHPDYRRKGFGEYFYRTVSNYFKSKGFKVVKLFVNLNHLKSFGKR